MNNTIVATDNTYITTSTTYSATGTTAINSLVINGGNLTVASNDILKDTSGALLFVTSNTIAPENNTTSALEIGSSSQEGIVSVDAGVTGVISSALAAANAPYHLRTGHAGV